MEGFGCRSRGTSPRLSSPPSPPQHHHHTIVKPPDRRRSSQTVENAHHGNVQWNVVSLAMMRPCSTHVLAFQIALHNELAKSKASVAMGLLNSRSVFLEGQRFASPMRNRRKWEGKVVTG